MQRLSVIAEIQDMLPAVREVVRESSQYNAGWNQYYADLIGTIHPSAKQPDKGPMTGMNRIADKAYEMAMDGEGRPFLAFPGIVASFNKRLNDKINDDIRNNRRICICMTEDFGDGEFLYPAGAFVFAAVTWSILAIHSGMARHATPEEIEMMKSQAVTQVDGGDEVSDSQSGFIQLDSPLRKAGLIHARRSAA